MNIDTEICESVEAIHIFFHHIYEYKKGLRNLILHTTKSENRARIVQRLEKLKIDHIVYNAGAKRINVFFGDSACVDVVRSIGKPALHKYSDEEDFILGIMLGYDRKKQCERYLSRKEKGDAGGMAPLIG